VDEDVTGYLFEARNVSQLADCMRKLLDSDRSRAFGMAARDRVVRLFSRQSWVDGDERVYIQWVQ
jgi:glycosyltransferase involved in cell wall biosynthesis